MLYIKSKNKQNRGGQNVSFSSQELNALNCFSSVGELYSFLNKVIHFSYKAPSEGNTNNVDEKTQHDNEQSKLRDQAADEAFKKGNVHDSGVIQSMSPADFEEHGTHVNDYQGDPKTYDYIGYNTYQFRNKLPKNK